MNKKEKKYLGRLFDVSEGLEAKMRSPCTAEFTGNQGYRVALLKERVAEGDFLIGYRVVKFEDNS